MFDSLAKKQITIQRSGGMLEVVQTPAQQTEYQGLAEAARALQQAGLTEATQSLQQVPNEAKELTPENKRFISKYLQRTGEFFQELVKDLLTGRRVTDYTRFLSLITPDAKAVMEFLQEAARIAEEQKKKNLEKVEASIQDVNTNSYLDADTKREMVAELKLGYMSPNGLPPTQAGMILVNNAKQGAKVAQEFEYAKQQDKTALQEHESAKQA